MNIINRKTKNFQLIFFQLVVIYLIGNSSGFSQTDFSVTIEHVNYENFDPEMTVGLATITYTPGAEGRYMSLGATDLSTYNFGIIVDNVYLPSNQEEDSPHSVSVTFDLGSLSTLGKLSSKDIDQFPSLLEIYFHLFGIISIYPFLNSTWINTQIVNVDEIFDDAKGAIPGGNNVSNAPVTPVLHIVNDGANKQVYRTHVQNLDLDGSQHPISATFAGDVYACVPTSVANSLKTLEAEFEDFNLPEGSNLRDVMEDLSGDMNRPDGEGLFIEPQIKGTLDYIETNNLPLEVKFQSEYLDDDVSSTSGNSSAANRNNLGKPTWDFLMQMMLEKEDVTINYKWTNPQGTLSAHAVCLSGASEFASGVKKISFKHDQTQSAAGGTTNQHEKINIDDDGAMRFGPNNSYEIFEIIAHSPTVPEGEEEEGLLNEILGWLGLGKMQYSLLDNNDFIEVALHENMQNLNDYRISLYDGTDGTVYQTITLDQFTAGTTVNSRVYYSYTMPANTLLTGPAGLSISYTGTVLPGQFISYGGSFTAVEGDATSMTSTNMGDFAQGNSFALSGTGSKYSDFTWTSSSNPSPGDVNPGQTYTLETYQGLSRPNSFTLSQNFPNPFNPSTTITFDLTEDTNVKISIYDMTGRLIRRLVNQPMTIGKKVINWDGRDKDGNLVSGGIYFYNLQSGGYSQTKKMVLMK